MKTIIKMLQIFFAIPAIVAFGFFILFGVPWLIIIAIQPLSEGMVFAIFLFWLLLLASFFIAKTIEDL